MSQAKSSGTGSQKPEPPKPEPPKPEPPKPSGENSRPKEKGSDRVSKPRVNAGPCEKNPRHLHTKIYKTIGRKRYCRCDDCGHLWVTTGPFADELKEYAWQLAISLGEAKRVDFEGERVIVMTDKIAKEIENGLRKRATAS